MAYFDTALELLSGIGWIEAAGLAFGLICVVLLIRQNVLTWPFGIAYVLISLYIFYDAKLYADLILHVFYLWMNIYGWYYWIHGRSNEKELPVTKERREVLIPLLIASVVGIAICGFLFQTYTDASVPYWDSTTTVLSFAAMWLTARKKIESWHLWLIVDVLATGIYYYKDLYFYAILYLVYIGLAVAGFLSWRESMIRSSGTSE